MAEGDHLEHLEHAFEHTRSGLAIVDAEGRIVRANHAGAAVVGSTPEDLRGRTFADMVHPDDLASAFAELARTLEGGFGGPVDLRIRRLDGSWVWIRAEATGLPTATPSIYAAFTDITLEREVAERLRRADALSARRAAQQAAVAQLGHEALTGHPVEELAGRAAEQLVAILDLPYCGVLLDDGHPAGPLLVAAAGLLTEEVGRYRFPRDDGGLVAVLAQPMPEVHTDVGDDLRERAPALAKAGISVMAAAPILPGSGRPGVISVGATASADFGAEDLTFLDSMANVLASALDAAAAMDSLRHNALHDDLTGLPNRALVLDRLEVALAAAAVSGAPVAVLVCDVDRFKVVNDGLGHAAGDAVLRAVAAQLRAEVRPGDTVGRFGGDEFVVVCPEIGDVDTVITIAERLATAVSRPVSVRGNDLVATVSIGIAVGTAPGAEAAAGLLSDADAAMYRAKARGRNRFELFDDAMRARADHRLRTETELRRALDRRELVLHYQPVLELDSARLVGVEALLRWQHPERGLLEPEAFVAVAGDSGLVPEVGAWALGEAARQTARWVAEGWWGDRFTAVNLAPRQLTDPLVVERVEQVLESSGVDPTLLRIEITEDALVDDSEQVAAILEAIRRHGIGISVDDFGTGYSSLAYLKRLPVDALKLDQGFVGGLGEDGDDMVIAAAVIVMAQALGLKVVAEGVETRPQLEVLRAMGCDLVQGYLFSRPLPADELADWARRAAAS